jgi:hypothetical protein
MASVPEALKSAVAKRVRGERLSPLHAALAAAAAGITVAVATYRLVRS